MPQSTPKPTARGERHDSRRQAKLARIHILARELDLTDPAYRNLLFVYTGERSAADLTSEQLHDAIHRLEHHKKIRNVTPSAPPVVTDAEAAAILGSWQ